MSIDLTHHSDYTELTNGLNALRASFSDYYQVDSELIIPTNGATGALDAVFSRTRADSDGKKISALVSSMEYFDAFRMLKLYGFNILSVHFAGVIYPTTQVIEALKNDAPGLLYISVPNNPTGQIVSEVNLDEILGAVPDGTRVIIDITLIGTPHYCSPRGLLRKYGDSKDIVVVDSLSKKRGLVKDRVGAIVALRRQTAVKIHSFAHATNLYGMQKARAHMNDVNIERELNEKIRRSHEILGAWNNDSAVYHPSNSNFACIELHTMTGSDCKKLLEKRGFKLRSGADIYIDDRYIRIDMEQPDVLRDFLGVLDHVFV